MTVWGTGNAKRDFLYVDDMAQASLYVLMLNEDIYRINTQPMLSHINIGTGKDITIREVAHTIKEVVGYSGELTFDISKPDGSPKKLIDTSRSLIWDGIIQPILKKDLKKLMIGI